MITQIQEDLLNIVSQSTNLSLQVIHLSPPTRNIVKPYACILPDKNTIQPAWRWELTDDNTNNRITIQRKYTINQKFKLTFEYYDKKEMDHAVHQFLRFLPKHLKIEDHDVLLNPTELEYQFSEGSMSVHRTILSLSAEYGILNHIKDDSIIKDISINITKPNKL